MKTARESSPCLSSGSGPSPRRAASVTTDLAIAREARPKPIAEIAAAAGVPDQALVPYGRLIAKLDRAFVAGLSGRPRGKLVLVTAINPTPAGEGKTTTTIGLGDALNRIGRRATIALREPSLGPVFGAKGGATGGGRAQVLPMEAINLHFTGDFHAITSAHNLLAALIDNHIHWGNALGIDTRRVFWKRALDMNDRALRQTVVGLGGPGNGFSREDGFDITVASEVMAIFCLARECGGPGGAAGPHGRGRDARPETRHGGRSSSRRSDERASRGRAPAQPRADDRGVAGADPWRAVRQHRAWLQQRDRDRNGAAARRVHRHGGGLRR